MKKLSIIAAFGVLFIATAILRSQTAAANPKARPTMGYLEQGTDGRFSETFNVMAGAELTVENAFFDQIEIRTTYPVAIEIGDCKTDSSVDFQCSMEVPQNIRVIDNRKGMDPNTTPSNAIQILARDSKFTVPANAARTIERSTVQTIHLFPLRKARFKFTVPISRFHVHASSAVSIDAGDCEDPYTFDFDCDEPPSAVTIRDLGQSQKLNEITITTYY